MRRPAPTSTTIAPETTGEAASVAASRDAATVTRKDSSSYGTKLRKMKYTNARCRYCRVHVWHVGLYSSPESAALWPSTGDTDRSDDAIFMNHRRKCLSKSNLQIVAPSLDTAHLRHYSTCYQSTENRHSRAKLQSNGSKRSFIRVQPHIHRACPSHLYPPPTSQRLDPSPHLPLFREFSHVDFLQHRPASLEPFRSPKTLHSLYPALRNMLLPALMIRQSSESL